MLDTVYIFWITLCHGAAAPNVMNMTRGLMTIIPTLDLSAKPACHINILYMLSLVCATFA